MENTKGWIGEFDLLRGFAILAIVFIHVGAFSLTVDQPNAMTSAIFYLTHLADFGVPVFFFISGYVLSLRYFNPGDIRTFYRKRLAVIIPPYLAFTALYVVYNYLALGQTSISRAAWSFFLFDSTGVFWFLAIIVQFYVLFPLMVTWLSRLEANGQGWRFLAYTAILYVVWWAALYQLVAQGINSVWQPVPNMGYIIADRSFPGYLLFFALGMFACRAPALTSTTSATLSRAYMVVPALLIAGVLTVLSTGFWWYMLVVPYGILMLALLHRLSRRMVSAGGVSYRSLETVGRYSFGLYLVHVLVIAVVVNRLWAWGLGASDGLFYLILFPATVIGGVLALWVLNLIPLGRYFSGVKTTRARRRKKGQTEVAVKDQT